jgi:hypothetical protein
MRCSHRLLAYRLQLKAKRSREVCPQVHKFIPEAQKQAGLRLSDRPAREVSVGFGRLADVVLEEPGKRTRVRELQDFGDLSNRQIGVTEVFPRQTLPNRVEQDRVRGTVPWMR